MGFRPWGLRLKIPLADQGRIYLQEVCDRSRWIPL
jgi:hypothetical protein